MVAADTVNSMGDMAQELMAPVGFSTAAVLPARATTGRPRFRRCDGPPQALGARRPNERASCRFLVSKVPIRPHGWLAFAAPQPLLAVEVTLAEPTAP